MQVRVAVLLGTISFENMQNVARIIGAKEFLG